MTCTCVELRIPQERGTTDRSQRRMKLQIRNSLAVSGSNPLEDGLFYVNFPEKCVTNKNRVSTAYSSRIKNAE
eukprot:scaffold22586_cov138-Cylindrotheca_fusiformis.AAC.41